jgi:hypothetical protein
MTDKSVFTEEEWHALTDAPLLVTEREGGRTSSIRRPKRAQLA